MRLTKFALLLLTVLCVFTGSFAGTNKNNSAKEQFCLTNTAASELMMRKGRIDITFTSQGYTFHLVGEASFNVWTGEYTFSGTISINGNGVHINNVPVNIKGNAYRTSASDPEVEKILNSDPEITSTLSKYIEAAAS